MHLSLLAGTTSKIVQIPVYDSSSTTGGMLTGLAFNTASLVAWYNREGAAGSANQISLLTATKGTWTTAGFVAVDGTNMPGWYELHVPNAAIAAGAKSVSIEMRGAANMVPVNILIELTATDNQDSVRGGMTALPNAAAAASGGLVVLGTNATAISFTAGMTISSASGNALALTSSGGNGDGLAATGNGSGHGIHLVPGATGNGLLAVGGATSGTAIKATGTAGNAIALELAGQGSAAGLSATGGATGIGITAVGGATSGSGIKATGSAGNAIALEIAGQGSAAGIQATGGATGSAFKLIGGGTSGHGLAVTTTSGDGFNLTPTAGNAITATANGTSKHGIVATGGTAGTSDGASFIAGTGGVDFRAAQTGALIGNITGNLSGSVGSVTGAVGSVTGAVGSVTGAVGSVTGAVASVTGNVGGNVVGSVASVTGAVGSVTGSVGSVTGAVGSVTGNVGGNVVGSVASVTADVGITQAGADKVWSTTTRALTDKIGFALSSAGVQAIWDALTSALTTVGSIGKLLVTNIDGTISSRSTYAGGDTSGTTTLLSRLTGTRATNLDNLDATISSRSVFSSGVDTVTVGTNNDKTGYRLSATGIDDVWDESTSGHTTAGTTGKALIDAGAVGSDPWLTALPGSYGAGTAGSILGTNLDATVSSRSTYAGADTSGTTTLLGRLTSTRAGLLDNLDAAVSTRSSHSAADVWSVGTRTLTAFTIAVDITSTAVSLVWDKLLTGITTASSIGKLIKDNLDAAVSSRSTYAGADTSGTTTLLGRLTSGRASNLDTLDAAISTRLASSGYTAPDNSDIVAIKAKTDNLPASPAAVSDIPTASANASATWDAVRASHTTSGTFGQGVSSVQGNVTGSAASVTADVGITQSAADKAWSTATRSLTDKSGFALTSAYDPAKTASQAGDAMALTTGERDSVAVAALKLDWTGIVGEASRSTLNALRFLRNKWSFTGTTLTVTAEDDTTSAWTGEVTTSSSAQPITSVDPT